MTEHDRLQLDRHEEGSRPVVWRTMTISTLLGFVTAAIAAALVYAFVPSEYRAAALIRISSDTPYIVFRNREESEKFITNQVELIRSRLVLGAVLGQPEIARMPELNQEEDRIAALAARIKVSSIGESDLFQISYTGPDPDDAAVAANAITDSYFELRGQYEAERMQRVIQILEEESLGRELEVTTLRDNIRELGKTLGVKDPLSTASSTDVISRRQQQPFENLGSRITTSEVELAVLKAQMLAYQEWMETNPITVPSSTVDQIIASTTMVQKLQKFVDDKRWSLFEIEIESTAVGHDTLPADQTQSPKEDNGTTDQEHQSAREEDSEVGHLQQQIQRVEVKLRRAAEQLRPEVTERVRESMADERKQKLAEIRAESVTKALTIDVLKQRYEEQLNNVKHSTIDTIELEFRRAELTRAEEVLNLIDSRILRLRTERRAPERVERLSQATAPSAPLKQLPCK